MGSFENFAKYVQPDALMRCEADIWQRDSGPLVVLLSARWSDTEPTGAELCEMNLSCEQTMWHRGVCVPALEPRGKRGRLTDEISRLQTGPGKFDRPAL